MPCFVFCFKGCFTKAVFQTYQKSQLHREAINNFMGLKGPVAHLHFTFSAGANLVVLFLFNKVYFDDYIENISQI